MPLIECRGLTKHYPIYAGVMRRQTGTVHAVDGVSITIDKGQTYSFVGESGCGKSTTGRLLMLLERPTAGRVLLDGTDITDLRGARLRHTRKRMQVVFQDPYSSLNPRMTVAAIVEEGILIHEPHTPADVRRDRAAHLLDLVGLSADQLDRYPHEFSGGQRQRIGLARALSTNPDFIVADEAVSALDVSIQAQIINLLRDLQQKLGLAYLFISHDLAVVRHLSHRVGVMYLGNLVEEADAAELFAQPLHPYTRALLSAIPEPDPEVRRERIILSGDVPRPDNPPSGCRFHTRCPNATPACAAGDIPECSPTPTHKVKCLLYS